MITKLLGAAGLLFVAITPVSAKDLAPASMYSWSGWYAGFHGGYGKANRNGCFDLGFEILGYTVIDEPQPITSCDGADPNFTFDYPQDQQGGLVGVQLGYNWEAAQHFLLGVEVSASATSMQGFLNDSVLSGLGQWNGILAATAKAGVTQGKWLFYAEGGVASAQASFLSDLQCDFNVTHTGPIAGAGVSVKLTQRVSLDLKYDHIWLNPQQSSCTPLPSLVDLVKFPTQIRSQGSMDVVKLGLNIALDGLGN